MITTPLELVQDKLDELIRARRHATDTLNKTLIDSDLWKLYMNNLNPIIEKYKLAIQILKQYMP